MIILIIRAIRRKITTFAAFYKTCLQLLRITAAAKQGQPLHSPAFRQLLEANQGAEQARNLI